MATRVGTRLYKTCALSMEDPLCNMLVPLEQRGSPARLPRLTRSFPSRRYLAVSPLPANRIVSLGDSSAAVAGPAVPSLCCAPQSQSVDGVCAGMTFPVASCLPAWTDCDNDRINASDSVSISESDSQRLHHLHQLAMACRLEESTTCGPIRPRAECSLKMGRMCRHTSCQTAGRDGDGDGGLDGDFDSGDSHAHGDSLALPKQTTFDMLHRDQRTVCVTTPFVTCCQRTFECSDQFSDSVQSVNNCEFELAPSGTSATSATSGSSVTSGTRSCRFQVKFSIQRFYSAVLCGLLLLTALRPDAAAGAPASSPEKLNWRTRCRDVLAKVASSQPTLKSMAAPDDKTTALRQAETPNWRKPCGGSFSKDANTTEIPQTSFKAVLGRLREQLDLTSTKHHEFQNYYYENRDGVGKRYGAGSKETFDVGVNPSYNFPVLNKKLNEKLERNHFEGKDVNELLVKAYSNLQAYALALTELVEDTPRRLRDPRTGTEDLYRQYQIPQRSVLELMCQLQSLLEQRGVEPPPDIDPSQFDSLRCDLERVKGSSTNTNVLDWMILREALNGVEYFEQLVEYVHSVTQQSHL